MKIKILKIMLNYCIKKNILFSMLFVLFLSIGCESTLDQADPNKITSDSFFQTEDDFTQALIAAYTPFANPNGYYGVRSMELRNYRGDDVEVRNDNENLTQIYLFVNSPINGIADAVFGESYSAIYRSNLILQKLEEADFLSADFKQSVKAEALFLRGMHYFILANEFKNVPLRLKASQAPKDFPLAKSSQAEVYAQVEKDLTEASSILPLMAAENGRATKGAALAYLGKLYIYTEKLDKAKQTLEPLTQPPYSYSLVEDYLHNLNIENEFNSESIFEIPYQKIGAATGRWGAENANAMMTSPMNRTFAAGDVGGWDICRGNDKIKNIFTQELDENGDFDIRARLSIAWDYPGCIFYLKPFNETVSAANQSKVYIRKHNYANLWPKENVPESEINIRAYRYSNVLLFLAEAELNLNNTPKAIGYLNEIRDRANLSLLPDNSSTMVVMEDIIRQRAIEFFAEGERFYDLRRWNKLEEEIATTTAERASNLQRKHDYLPLPSSEIQTNGLLVQNEPW